MQKNDDFKFIALEEAKVLLGDSHMTDERFAQSLIAQGPRYAAVAADLALLLKFGEE